MDISWQRRIISFIIGFPCRLKFFRRRPVPIIPKKILVIQWGYLGDIVVSTPALQLLRMKYPSAKIYLLTNPLNKSYIDGFPFADKILYMENPLHIGRSMAKLVHIFACIRELRKEQYDIVVEFTGRLTNQILLFFIKARYLAGYDPIGSFYLLDKLIIGKDKNQIEIDKDIIRSMFGSELKKDAVSLWNPVKEEDRTYVSMILNKYNVLSPFIIIHPTASWGPRQWLPERWIEVCKFLISENKSILFIGTQKDKNYIKTLCELLDSNSVYNFAGLFNICQTIALIERGSLFIGSDSGPMHLAAITDIDSIILFGPGNVTQWAHEKHVIIHKNIPCSPCPQFAFTNLCIMGKKICDGLTAISADEVINECRKIFRK